MPDHSQHMAPRPDRFSPAWRWSILVGVLSLLAFAPALHDGFVFDDVAQARDLKPAVGMGSWLRSAADPWWPPEKNKNIWRPVTRLVILAEKSLARGMGPDPPPWPFHLAGLIFNAFNALLILALARALGWGWPGAGAAALLIGVHPLRGEAVHQIVGQAELLASIFMLAGATLYARARRANRSWIRIGAAQILFYALALGSKEHAILYPLLPALIELSLKNRGAPSPKPDFKKPACVIAAMGLVPALFLTGKFLVTGGLIENPDRIPAYENEMARMDWTRRAPAAMGVFAYAAGKALIPVGLSPDYSSRALPLETGWSWPLAWVGCALAAALAAWGALQARRRRRGWLLIVAGMGFYALTSNFFFTIGVGVSERLWHFPLTAMGLAMGWYWERMGADGASTGAMAPRFRLVAPLTLLTAVGLLLAAAWHDAPTWNSELSRSLATIERFPDCWRAHHNLAREYYKVRNTEAGYAHALRAVRIRPEAAVSWDYLGQNAMFDSRLDDEAQRAFQRAIEADPSLARAWLHLGNLHRMRGRPGPALQAYEHYLEFDPDDRPKIEERIAELRAALNRGD